MSSEKARYVQTEFDRLGTEPLGQPRSLDQEEDIEFAEIEEAILAAGRRPITAEEKEHFRKQKAKIFEEINAVAAEFEKGGK